MKQSTRIRTITFISALLYTCSALPLTYTVFKGTEVRPYLFTVADMTVRLLKDFPYLYESTAEQEDMDCYHDSPHTLMIGAFDDNRLVGVALGLPLHEFCDKPCNFYAQEALSPFGLPTQHTFYLSLLLVEKEYQHRGIGLQLMDLLMNAVSRDTYSYTHMCSLVIERSHDDPRAQQYDWRLEQISHHYVLTHDWHAYTPLIPYGGGVPAMRLWSKELEASR